MLQHETWPIDKLIEYARNPRKNDHAVDRVAAAIHEFGFRVPVVAKSDGTVVDGHLRLKAAKKLGLTEVPVVLADDMTDVQIKAFRLSVNKMAELAEWDDEMLKLELIELEEMDFDLELTGFSLDEIADLTVEEVPERLTDEDAVPELQPEPISKLGDVWILGKHRVMCGDSTSIDAVETLMAGAKADMVFTDPPYGVDYKGIKNDDRGGLEELLRGAFGNFLAVSKSGASIYVFHSDRCADIFHQVFREFFHFSSMIIWAKNSLTLSQTDYQSQHEPCLYGWMDNGTHSWHSDRKQTSVWRFDKERVAGHTTPKPVELVAKGINNSSKGGDTVLDLFGGSGSTMIACEKTGREARLMELDGKYVDVIVRRWQEFTGKLATHEATGATFAEVEAEIVPRPSPRARNGEH